MPRERYCFIMYPGKWVDEFTSVISGNEVVLFDRTFLGGQHAAIRRAKRSFRRHCSVENISDFRLFRVTDTGRDAILMPTPRGRSYPPTRIEWDENRLAEVIN